MREEWANNKDRKPVQSFLLVFVIVAAGMAMMLPLSAPKVKAITHLGSTSAEDGGPEDMTGPGDFTVLWDAGDSHIMNVDYVVESGWELIIPALNDNGLPPREITVTAPINITVQTGGKLTFETDGNLSKTSFFYSGSGYWDGIYFEPGSEGVIQDVRIEYAKKAITLSPGTVIGSPGISDCRFNFYSQFGIDMNGAVGHTDITNTVFNDNLTSGEGVRIKSGFLNISDSVTFIYHGSGLSSIHVIDATAKVGPDVNFQCGSQPGYAVHIQEESDNTVIQESSFNGGASGYEYVRVEGSSTLVDNCSFELDGGQQTILATYDINGIMSHPLLRNPNPGSSFDNTTITAVWNSTVSLQWWVDVYVKDGYNNPIPSAPVWVMDADSNPAEPYSKMTDATGWAKSFLTTELIQHDGWRVNNNPFNISAENNSITGYADTENSTVTSSRTSIVVIGPFPLLNNTPPIVSYISTPIGIQSGPVSIDYTLYDPDLGDDGDLEVLVEYWDDTWGWVKAEADVSSDPITGLSSGVTYTFVWDSNHPNNMYNKYSTYVEIRITPYDNTGVGTPGQTNNFTVDNTIPSPNTPPIVSSLSTPAGIQSGLVTIDYILMDPDPGDDGSLSIEVYFSIDNSTWYPATMGPGGDPITGLLNNTLYQFVWDSTDPNDLPGVYSTTVYLKVLPFDLAGAGTPAQTGNFTLDNKAPVFPSPPLNIMAQLSSGSMNDVELLWSASPDDGAGYDDVAGYTVYKSSTGVNGSYGFAAWITANGSLSYMWTDIGAGDGDWNDYYYIVRANDTLGNEEQNTYKMGKFVNYLVDGWNLISVPLIQINTTIEYVLQTIMGNLISVQGYHAGKSRPWKNWHKDKPKHMNDVIEIDHKNGYYIKMIIPDYLVVCGKAPTDTSIHLKAGWNLVGYPSVIPRTVADALASIDGMYNKVEFYNTTTDKEEPLAPDDYMLPGLGYWIHTTQECVWEVPL